jgi:hypothetical protein
MSTTSPVIDAEARGRLRRWKAQLRQRYRVIDRMAAAEQMSPDVVAFALRGSPTGRQRAFARLNSNLTTAGAVLHTVRYEGRSPIAVWAILKPRTSVAIETEDPRLTQDCITVNYILVGCLTANTAHRGDGLWSLEVPDHALGRLLQRTAADPTAILFAAHHAAWRLHVEQVVPDHEYDPNYQFLPPAGAGAFVCSTRVGEDTSLGTPSMHLYAHTWLAADMLHEGQVPLCDDGLPGARLGDGWLLPAMLRKVTDDNGLLTGQVWEPGLPATLDAPAGRA